MLIRYMDYAGGTHGTIRILPQLYTVRPPWAHAVVEKTRTGKGKEKKKLPRRLFSCRRGIPIVWNKSHPLPPLFHDFWPPSGLAVRSQLCSPRRYASVQNGPMQVENVIPQVVGMPFTFITYILTPSLSGLGALDLIHADKQRQSISRG